MSFPEYDALSMPESVLKHVRFTPIEEIALEALRDEFEPDVRVGTLIPNEFAFRYFILVRRVNRQGYWDGHKKLVDNGGLSIDVYTHGPNGDQEGALLSEAVRSVLMEAHRSQRVFTGGHILSLTMQQEPRPVPDWATAVGPVQYADLPHGFWRYETIYDIQVRVPRGRRTG